MALVKSEVEVGPLQSVRDAAGALVDAKVEISFVVKDDVTQERYGRITKVVSVWADLTATQKTALSGIAIQIANLVASKI